MRAIITPHALAPAALDELKQWLGITLPADDTELTGLLRAAMDACEGFTGQMPLQQLCEEILPVQSDWGRLRTLPVQAITMVEGIPAEGSRFALPVGDYAIDLDADGGGRVLIRNPGAAGRIALRFTAGIAADWASLPPALRHGILRLAAHHYRNRNTPEGAAIQPPAAIAALWQPWRRLRLA